MIIQRQRLVITPSIDSRWDSTAEPNNLTDGNNATEIQTNNLPPVQHWVQLDFNVPYRLSNLAIRARGGGAGCGPIRWVTSNGQVVDSASQSASADFNVSFNGSFVTWVRGTFTSLNTNFDGFGEITPSASAASTVRGIMRRTGGATSVRAGRLGSSMRPKNIVTISVSADTTWYSGSLSNLIDFNDSTEIQANNQSCVNHWIQLSFSPPMRLTTLRLFARGGGAGAGNCTWVTSDSQSQSNGSMSPSTSTILTFSGAAVDYVRGTFTAARTNFDGWGELSANGAGNAWNTYLGGYSRF